MIALIICSAVIYGLIKLIIMAIPLLSLNTWMLILVIYVISALLYKCFFEKKPPEVKPVDPNFLKIKFDQEFGTKWEQKP